MEEWPPDMEGSCEYIEQVVADSRQGWSSSLGLGEVLTSCHLKKLIMLRNIQRSRRIVLILRYDLSNGKRI
jgi:hypothetical protein